MASLRDHEQFTPAKTRKRQEKLLFHLITGENLIVILQFCLIESTVLLIKLFYYLGSFTLVVKSQSYSVVFLRSVGHLCTGIVRLPCLHK